MSSIGFLLADWSIELLRSKKKRLQKKENKEKFILLASTQTEEASCSFCDAREIEINSSDAELRPEESVKRQLQELLGTDSFSDIPETLTVLIKERKSLQESVYRLKEETVQLCMKIEEEKDTKETFVNERINILETELKEKENKLMETAQSLKFQLEEAKKDAKDLTSKLEEIKCHNQDASILQKEVDNLQLQLSLKQEEINHLTTANNSSQMQLENMRILHKKLEVKRQKSEELQEVVRVKNLQLIQVLDKFEVLQHELEIEVAAHQACQQELERAEWARESFIQDSQQKDRKVRGHRNTKKVGFIVDIVQKDKGVSYDIKCS